MMKYPLLHSFQKMLLQRILRLHLTPCLLCLFMLGNGFYVNGQTNLKWAAAFGYTGDEQALAHTSDTFGNVYVTGSFFAADFDPGAGMFGLSASASDGQVFIQKLDKNGALVWAKTMLTDGPGPWGSLSNYSRGHGIELDGAGNVHTAGSFSGEVDLDPGVGVFLGTSILNFDPIFFQYNYETSSFIQKLDPSGNFISATVIDGIEILQMKLDLNGNTYISGKLLKDTVDMDPGSGVSHLIRDFGINGANNIRHRFVAKLDNNHNLVWAKLTGGVQSGYYRDNKLEITSTDDVFIIGNFKNTIDFDPGSSVFNLTAASSDGSIFVQKLDANGNFLWAGATDGSSNTEAELHGIAIDQSDNLYLTGNYKNFVDFDFGSGSLYPSLPSGNQRRVFVLKMNSNGQTSWVKSMGNDWSESYAIALDAKRNIYTIGRVASVYQQSAWSYDFDPGPDTYIPSILSNINAPMYLHKLDSDGNFKWMEFYTGTNGEVLGEPNISVDIDENILVTGTFEDTIDFELNPDITVNLGAYPAGFPGATSTDFFVQKLNIKKVYGAVHYDQNNNCLIDGTEIPLANHIIEFTKSTGAKSYATTDSLGKYEKDISIGNFDVRVIPQNSYWESCPLVQNVIINSLSTVDTVDWAMQAVVNCPLLSVSIGAPFLRATGGGSSYAVSYCNNGTDEAASPYVEVMLDPNLTVLNTSIPYSSQNGTTYSFPLDTLSVGECGSFSINVIASPIVPVAQVLCSEAHIYPDSICLPIWNGPVIEADASCQIDTIFFKLKNTGSNMLAAQNYTIFEDDIIVRLDTFILNGGDSITIKQVTLANKVYRIEANQTFGFPPTLGAPIVHATVTDCNAISTNLGIIPQFYTGNSSPFIAIDCQSLIAAYDPNDKQAQPEGYGVNHYLLPNLPIDYRVRFQNTGNDTAFLVVVVDTLSPHVDVSSIQMGASSHPYTWELTGPGILAVTFANIKLVDSTTNEPLSNGFFSYSIQQQADLPTGTLINNRAAIYFDYNPPIITNTAFHTIARYFYKSRLLRDSIICASDSFFIDGLLVDTSGTYTEYLAGTMGQDSITIWNMTVEPNPTAFYSDTVCNSIIINGVTYDSTGIYTQLIASAVGCDTVLTIDLFVYNTNDTLINVISCDSFMLNGQVYTSSGIYTQTISNSGGCDSLITINLTINTSSNALITTVACDSFVLNGQVYTSSGIYTQTISNSTGCDSLVTINLTINNSTNTLITTTACDSFVLNGQVYTSSGIYTQTLSNSAGCDSLITINLTLNTSSNTLLNATACDSFLLNGQVYTSSGIYTQTLSNSTGCDSLITLNLVLNNSSITNLIDTACNGYTLNGFTYVVSGNYTQTLTSTIGCDSILNLDLVVLEPSITYLIDTACNSYDWNNQNYTNSGTYTQTLSNVVGCDSTIVLDLTIESIDLTLSLNGLTLISNEAGATYQWLDCTNNFMPIQGAIGQTFTPTQNGDYAVEITKQNCTVISTCENIIIMKTKALEKLKEIQLYPNPTQGIVTIDLDESYQSTSIEILSVDGQVIYEKSVENKQLITLDIAAFSSGLYLLRINTGEETHNLKLLKE